MTTDAGTVRDRFIGAVTAPSPLAEVTVVRGLRAVRFACGAGWAAMRKGGVRGAVPIAAAVVAAVIVAAVLWWAVARALPANIAALVVAAGAVVIVAGAAAVARFRESAEPVRVVALGEDRETVQVRFGCGSAVVVQGWAYLDRRRGGDPKRSSIAARRVVEFADAERLTLHAAVAASASAVRSLYAEFGFMEVPLGGCPWRIRLPARVLRLVVLVRPAHVDRSVSGRSRTW